MAGFDLAHGFQFSSSVFASYFLCRMIKCPGCDTHLNKYVFSYLKAQGNLDKLLNVTVIQCKMLVKAFSP